jgi:mono/diheme cytochrome c family protein
MKKRHLQLGLLLLVGIAAAFYLVHPVAPAQRVAASEVSAQRAFINENCVACHNDKAKTADVSLVGVDYDGC